MRSIAIVDTGPLVAVADDAEPDHDRCVEVLQRRDLDLVIPALVVAEAAYIIARRLGAHAEATFVRGLSSFAIEAPAAADWPSIADVVERYADLDLGTTDASIVVLADRLETDVVITLDRRHFGVVRSPSGRAFRLLPEGPFVHEDAPQYG